MSTSSAGSCCCVLVRKPSLAVSMAALKTAICILFSKYKFPFAEGVLPSVCVYILLCYNVTRGKKL